MEQLEKYKEKKGEKLTLRKLNEAFLNAKFATFRIKRKGNRIWLFGEMCERPRIDIDRILFNVTPVGLIV